MKLTPLALSVFALTSVVNHANAASYSIDARGDGMGGVGVVGANYLTAPFYNPALAAVYRRNDDAGMLLPSIGLSYDDQDDLIGSLDGVTDLISSGASSSAAYHSALDELDGKALKANIGTAVAVGIPNRYMSMSIYGKLYSDTYVAPDIPTEADYPDAAARASNSTIDAVTVAVLEGGVSIAKYYNLFGQHVTLGITPKLQRINTYFYTETLDNYDIFSVLDNSTSETSFNIDAGALWFYGPIRVGLSAMNIISRDITTLNVGGKQYNYSIGPVYTLGVGLVGDYAQVSVDYDLNVQKGYDEFDDDTQMLRVGGEIDLMRQLKLRGGYKKNLKNEDDEGTYTAGIGLSPLGLFEMDVAVSYTNENSMGGYINFLSTY